MYGLVAFPPILRVMRLYGAHDCCNSTCLPKVGERRSRVSRSLLTVRVAEGPLVLTRASTWPSRPTRPLALALHS